MILVDYFEEQYKCFGLKLFKILMQTGVSSDECARATTRIDVCFIVIRMNVHSASRIFLAQYTIS